MMKKVLFIGAKSGNSYLELLVLKKIFKKVDVIDTKKILGSSKIYNKIFHHVLPNLFEKHINSYILKRIQTTYDLIYTRSGEFISKKLLLDLKKKNKENSLLLFG